MEISTLGTRSLPTPFSHPRPPCKGVGATERGRRRVERGRRTEGVAVSCLSSCRTGLARSLSPAPHVARAPSPSPHRRVAPGVSGGGGDQEIHWSHSGVAQIRKLVLRCLQFRIQFVIWFERVGRGHRGRLVRAQRVDGTACSSCRASLGEHHAGTVPGAAKVEEPSDHLGKGDPGVKSSWRTPREQGT